MWATGADVFVCLCSLLAWRVGSQQVPYCCTVCAICKACVWVRLAASPFFSLVRIATSAVAAVRFKPLVRTQPACRHSLHCMPSACCPLWPSDSLLAGSCSCHHATVKGSCSIIIRAITHHACLYCNLLPSPTRLVARALCLAYAIPGAPLTIGAL